MVNSERQHQRLVRGAAAVALMVGAMFADAFVPLSPWTWLVIWLFVTGYDIGRLLGDYRTWQNADPDQFAFVPMFGFVSVRLVCLGFVMFSALMLTVALMLVGRSITAIIA